MDYRIYFGFLMLGIGISWNVKEEIPSWIAFMMMGIGSMLLAYSL